MCETCGCSPKSIIHSHSHCHDGHEHTHEHTHAQGDDSHGDHQHADGDAAGGSRIVEVERRVLAKNAAIAEENRAWLQARGVVAVNIISSPGAGKTTLLEKTLDRMSGRIRCGVIVGDQQTDNDARRLANRGAPVRQIETISSCHLDAERIQPVLKEVVGEEAKLLFIENVGNLICPAAFDLGEDFKIVLLSVTEGEDKPLKYPVVFSRAKVVVLTKIDLAPHLEWDREKCLGYIKQAAPGARVIELSARTGDGMDEWCHFLAELVE